MTQGRHRGADVGGLLPSAWLRTLLGVHGHSDPSSQLPGLQHPCSRCRQQARLVPWSPGCVPSLSLGQPWCLSCFTESSCAWAFGILPEGSAHPAYAKPGVFLPAETLLPPDCLNFGSIKVQAVKIEPDARSPSHTALGLVSPSGLCPPGLRLHTPPQNSISSFCDSGSSVVVA